MILTGIPNTQISTPYGMVTLNRNGQANLVLKTTVDFIAERIAAGGLPGFELVDETPNVSRDAINRVSTGDMGADESDHKKKPKA